MRPEDSSPDGSFCSALLLKHVLCSASGFPESYLLCKRTETWQAALPGVICSGLRVGLTLSGVERASILCGSPPGWPGSLTARRLPWDKYLGEIHLPFRLCLDLYPVLPVVFRSLIPGWFQDLLRFVCARTIGRSNLLCSAPAQPSPAQPEISQALIPTLPLSTSGLHFYSLG